MPDRNRVWRAYVAVVACFAVIAGAASLLRGEESAPMNQQAHEFAGIADWINGDATTLAALRGKVVVLHFWTFGCINCQQNLPYYNRWFNDFPKGDVRIVGVHTPETTGEGELESVAANVEKRGIKYLVAVDNERATWDAYGNRYWPSVYVIDKKGRVRYRWDGELESSGQHGDAAIREKVKEWAAE